MATTISMEDMRHLNLFSKITRVSTRYCFSYNDTLMFAVPKPKLNKALGKNGENLKKLSDILKKRVRIVPQPRGVEDLKYFVQLIISPVVFKEITVNDKEVVINAGSVQTKAALLGRNKRRLEEMKKIIQTFFNLD
jgi:NusA-like KH domain protein